MVNLFFIRFLNLRPLNRPAHRIFYSNLLKKNKWVLKLKQKTSSNRFYFKFLLSYSRVVILRYIEKNNEFDIYLILFYVSKNL